MKKAKEDVENTELEEIERDLFLSILQQFEILFFFLSPTLTLLIFYSKFNSGFSGEYIFN